MRKLRYAVYDTVMKKYLERAEAPMDGEPLLVTLWTRRAEQALRFPGVKSARAMQAKLASQGGIVIINGRGEIVE